MMCSHNHSLSTTMISVARCMVWTWMMMTMLLIFNSAKGRRIGDYSTKEAVPYYGSSSSFSYNCLPLCPTMVHYSFIQYPSSIYHLHPDLSSSIMIYFTSSIIIHHVSIIHVSIDFTTDIPYPSY